VQEMNSRVELAPELTSAQRAAAMLKQDRDEWSSLRDAWKQRGYGLSKMVELYTAQYFSLSRSQGGHFNTVPSGQAPLFSRGANDAPNTASDAATRSAAARRRLQDD